MAQRRFHYEQAFEHYLRANRIPYVAVDEAKKALLPARRSTARLEKQCSDGTAEAQSSTAAIDCGRSIKSFDFVVYAPGRNLLVDVKGRMFGSAKARTSLTNRRFESWVTDEDVEGLTHWQELFGEGFQATFVFAYCLRQQPPDALFEELFSFGGRWYALREAPLASYCRVMERRSASWGTVHVPAAAFSRISRPFSVREPEREQHRPVRRLAG